MSQETYALKSPVSIGKLTITELQIDRVAKGKYWRVAQQPMAVDTATDGSEGVTVHITNGEAEIALMQAMTGQPLAVLDELGVDDFDYVYGAAVEMLGNFRNTKHLPKMEAPQKVVNDPQPKLEA